MIVDPPSDAGAVNAADSWRFDPATVLPTIAGAPGTVAGVAVCGDDAAPVPTALIARTLTWYVVPFVSPVTHDRAR